MSPMAIVGVSDSGKTLLAEQVTRVAVERGLRVAYVKHAPHGFHPGKPGADSDRVRAAGADPVVVVGTGGLFLVEADGSGAPVTAPLDLLLSGLVADVVLLEGFSESPWPKIRVTMAGKPPRDVVAPVVLEAVRHGQAFPPDTIGAVLAHATGNPVGGRLTLQDGTDAPLRDG